MMSFNISKLSSKLNNGTLEDDDYTTWDESDWNFYKPNEDYEDNEPSLGDGTNDPRLVTLTQTNFEEISSLLKLRGFKCDDGRPAFIMPITDPTLNSVARLARWYWRRPQEKWKIAGFQFVDDFDLGFGESGKVAKWTFGQRWNVLAQKFGRPLFPGTGVELAYDNLIIDSFFARGNESKTSVVFPPPYASGSRDIVGIIPSQTSSSNSTQFASVFLRQMPGEDWVCRQAVVALMVEPDDSKATLSDLSCDEHRARAQALEMSRAPIRRDELLTRYDVDPGFHNFADSGLIDTWYKGSLTGQTPRAWQIAAFDSWIAHGRYGIIEAATGSGKTQVGIVAAIEAIHVNLAVVIVVPTLALQDQWVNLQGLQGVTVERLDGENKNVPRRGQILVAVYPSFVKMLLNSNFSLPPALLIADEVHNYGGTTSSQILSPHFQRRLGLTATLIPNENNLVGFYNYFGGPPVFSHTFECAVADGSISPFQLILARCDMEGSAFQKYLKLRALREAMHRALVHAGVEEARTRLTDSQLQLLRSNLDFHKITERLIEVSDQLDSISSQLSGVARAMFEISPIVREYKGTIIFSDSVAACDEINTALRNERVSIERITSAVKGEQRMTILKNFGKGRIDALVSPKVLDEGIDIQNCHTGFFVGGSRRKLQLIQRMGRALRVAEGKSHARIIFLVPKGSDDDPAAGDQSRILERSALKFIYDSSLKPVQVVDVDDEGALFNALGGTP